MQRNMLSPKGKHDSNKKNIKIARGIFNNLRKGAEESSGDKNACTLFLQRTRFHFPSNYNGGSRPPVTPVQVI